MVERHLDVRRCQTDLRLWPQYLCGLCPFEFLVIWEIDDEGLNDGSAFGSGRLHSPSHLASTIREMSLKH